MFCKIWPATFDEALRIAAIAGLDLAMQIPTQIINKD
jgi:hypothetical protein